MWCSKESIEENIDSEWSISGRSLSDAKEKMNLNDVNKKVGYVNLPIIDYRL